MCLHFVRDRLVFKESFGAFSLAPSLQFLHLLAHAAPLNLINPRILESSGLSCYVMLLHERGYAAGLPVLLNRHRHHRRAIICAVELVLLGISDSFCSQIDRYAILIVQTVVGIVLD